MLDAKSGEPLPGAEVLSWTFDNQNRRVARPKLLTDENGFFYFVAKENVRYALHARHHGQELGSLQDYSRSYNEIAVDERVFFFTDRAIYRPGQTIQYKGIAVKIDSWQDDYQLLTAGKSASFSPIPMARNRPTETALQRLWFLFRQLRGAARSVDGFDADSRRRRAGWRGAN